MTWRRIKSVVLAWDVPGALVPVALGVWLLPPAVGNKIASGFYSAGMSVLAIMFSVFFAALAIILSASDDEFVRWLDEKGSYRELIWSFRFTLGALFGSLLVAIGAYTYTAFLNENGTQANWLLILFGTCAGYALLATFNASMDAARYCALRADYLSSRPRRPHEHH